MSKVTLDMTRIRRALSEDKQTLHIHIPMQIKKRGGRKEIVLPEAQGDAAANTQNQSLAANIALAHRWVQVIEEGRIGSVSELATRLNLDLSYLNRMLRLSLLAPDIVESILGNPAACRCVACASTSPNHGLNNGLCSEGTEGS